MPVADVLRAMQPAVHRAAVVAGPLDQSPVRAGRALRSRRAAREPRRCGRPCARTRRPASACAPRANRGEMRSPCHDRPPCAPLPNWRLSPVATSTMFTDPKPSSLRQNTMRSPSGDHAYERCPSPHDGSPCSVVLVHERLLADPQVEPPGLVGEVRERSVGREARLLHADARPARRDGRSAGAVRRGDHDAPGVPRHVGDVPLVPRDGVARRRPHGVEAEVGGRRAAHRPTVAVERRDARRDVGRRRTRRACRRGSPRARRSDRRAAWARHTAARPRWPARTTARRRRRRRRDLRRPGVQSNAPPP